MGDVERNENAICVYPRVQYCMCESCWRRFTHVLIDRACAYSCNGLHTPSSSPLSIVALSLSPFNLYLTTLVYFCSVSLSLSFSQRICPSICLLLPLSLSPYLPYYALSSLFILSFSILLCSSLRLSVSFLKWILYLVLLVYQFIYIMIPVIFSVCVSFCKRLHLSFPLEDFTTCICSVCATYCHLLSRAFLFEISDDIESKI